MSISNKFIFTYLIALILFTPIFLKSAHATQDKSVDHSLKNTGHREEIAEHDSKSVTNNHGEKVVTHIEADGADHGNEQGLPHSWPHYGKMVIFAEIMLIFMLFSFIAPLVHFYLKGEKHH